MKKKILIFACAAFAVVSFSVTLRSNKEALRKAMNTCNSNEVEVLSACESVGWWNNDGNCVKNSAGVYFCKEDGFWEITDCKQ